MKIGYQYIPLIIAGLAAMAWGFPAAHRLKIPFDISAAVVVLCGVIAAVLGVLLTIIPGFFR
jgi:VIT1/CCC1 family predicted Fe2+/Mn2+ transporter